MHTIFKIYFLFSHLGTRYFGWNGLFSAFLYAIFFYVYLPYTYTCLKKYVTHTILYRIFLVWLDIILQMLDILKWLKELIKTDQLTKN